MAALGHCSRIRAASNVVGAVGAIVAESARSFFDLARSHVSQLTFYPSVPAATVPLPEPRVSITVKHRLVINISDEQSLIFLLVVCVVAMALAIVGAAAACRCCLGQRRVQLGPPGIPEVGLQGGLRGPVVAVADAVRVEGQRAEDDGGG
jgi:hypothetical protein